MDANHFGLKALESCAEDAGFIRNADGEITTKKARVQVVIFNAISKLFVNMNRRSHDKLMVVDGRFPEKALAMTGGRNISLSYYGILADGSPNPGTYMDAEILVRKRGRLASEDESVGRVAEAYFTLLFYFENNHRLRPIRSAIARNQYAKLRRTAQDQLAALKAIPAVKDRLDAMPEYIESDWREGKVLLAHEFGNLTADDPFSDPVAHLERNPNSIQHLLGTFRDQHHQKRARIVSPYLFAPEFYDEDGNEVLDGARNALRWLEEDPERTLEIITNSVLTSDNFPAQSVIDMNMAPRLLLPEDWREAWLDRKEDGSENASLVGSDDWHRLVHHPQLAIYETGRLDARELGGDVDYGKLHAKYIIIDDGGFVGTTNFDYRSRLLNNEMGFFFVSKALVEELSADFERLKSLSYRWGSSEWLQMRQELFATRGLKANTARSQRGIYKTLRRTGLDKQF
jgi:phosphatidylserine/phosphatidylglycerophosphate/cardiolipin synthase-like enzyme